MAKLSENPAQYPVYYENNIKFASHFKEKCNPNNIRHGSNLLAVIKL
jgi:hypothetical protein